MDGSVKNRIKEFDHIVKSVNVTVFSGDVLIRDLPHRAMLCTQALRAAPNRDTTLRDMGVSLTRLRFQKGGELHEYWSCDVTFRQEQRWIA